MHYIGSKCAYQIYLWILRLLSTTDSAEIRNLLERFCWANPKTSKLATPRRCFNLYYGCNKSLHQYRSGRMLRHNYKKTRRNQYLPKPPTPFVKRILELILKRKYIEFDGEFYIQTWGVAMGNIASPEISDSVMHWLEKEFILTDPNILYYARYRDDIWIFYQPKPNELSNLISNLNRCHKTLKFTSEISDQQVTFLDLQIFKGSNFAETGILDHRVNQKAADTHQWLDSTSAHCPSVFEVPTKGESLRYLRGNTIETEFINKVNFFTDTLVTEVTTKVKLMK